MKCKVCNKGQGNPMHLFGHHFFVSDTVEVDLPKFTDVVHNATARADESSTSLEITKLANTRNRYE